MDRLMRNKRLSRMIFGYYVCLVRNALVNYIEIITSNLYLIEGVNMPFC
jgi:hypothetical protein